MELLDIGKVFLGINCNALYLRVMAQNGFKWYEIAEGRFQQVATDKADYIEIQYKKQAVQ